MENSWQVKCGSTLQSSAPSLASSSSQELRNQTERNAGYYSYSHDPRDLSLKVLGMVQDPLLPNYPDLSFQKSGHVNLGNSFLALLSGPPSLLQCDFKELSNSKLMSDGSSVIVNAIGNGIPLRFSGSPLEYMSEQNLQPGVAFSPSNSTRGVEASNCNTNSVLPGLQSPDVETTTVHCMVPSSEKAKGSLSINGEWHGAVAPNTGKLSSTKVQTSQMKSLEENSSISNQYQSSKVLSECPRVFCLGTGGYLLISNTGLLGVVCSCHSLHMSVLKFCEHSGLCGVNPGDAVCMDNGQTIAQWRKLYFQKFGIRVSEEQSDWDWPEGLSATSGLVKSRTTLPNISHLAHSSGGLSRSGQLSDNAMLSNLHTNQSMVIDASQNKQKRDGQASNIPLKGLIDTSQSNKHPAVGSRVTDSTVSKSVGSGLQDGCQSISAYTDFILKNRDLSITRPSMQDLRTISQKSDFTMFKNAPNSIFVGRDAAFSNIELKLGQPYQSSQNSKISDRPALGSHLLDRVINPSKLVFPGQMIHNSCRGKVELGQSLYFATGSCSPNMKREQNQLNLGNNGFEGSNINSAAILEKSRGNLVQSAVVPLTNFNLLAENNVQMKPSDNILNCLEHTANHTQYYEPRFAKCDSSNVPWNSGNGLERQLNINEMSSHGLIDKGKGVKLISEGSYFLKDSGSRIHKEFEFSTSRSQVPASQGSSSDLYQWSTVPLEAPEVRKLCNYPENIPSFGNCLNVDHVSQRSFTSSVGSGIILPSQVVTKGLPLATSTHLLDQTPSLHREESIGVSPNLLDDNLRMLALRQILELSKQQHAFPSFGMNKREGRCDGVSYLHHSFAESPAAGEQFNGPGPISSREVSEATARARLGLAGATSKFSGDEGFSSLIGMTGCCDLSTLIRGIPIHTKEIAVQGQRSSEQSSMRHRRNEKNIAGRSEHEKCCRVPSMCSQRSCNCSVHMNCFTTNLESTVGSCPIALKEQRGLVNGEASVIFGSKFAKNHFVQNDEIISSDQGEKLNEKLPNNIGGHASQWRDVPSKVKRVSTTMCRDSSAECINVTMQTKNSSKENETSNISSGSSAPAVTQLSVEVNKTDYSCADAGNTGCVSNLVVDEGSGIDKCWSSDDACGSERSEDFHGDNCKTSFKESGSSKSANCKSSRSLLDELKLINSLTWKKGPKQIQTGTFLNEEDHLSNKLNRCLKKGKKNRDCSSLVRDESNEGTNSAEFPSSASQQLHSLSSHRKNFGSCSNQQNSEPRLSTFSTMKKPSRKRDIYKIYNDKEEKDVSSTEFRAGASSCETPEISAGKRYKKDCTSTSNGRSLIGEQTDGGSRTKNKYNSIGCMRSSLNCQANTRHCKSKPIVCGKYGELSDGELVGNMSKPAKIVPLSRVLLLARRCTLPKNEKRTFTSIRGMKKTHGDGADGFHRLRTEKESTSHDAAVSGTLNNETFLEKMKNRCSGRDDKFAEDLSMLEIERHESEKACEKEDSIAHARLKSRSKEIRKRSIYELAVDGEGPHNKTLSLSKTSKCSPEVSKGTILGNGEDRTHGLCEVAQKSQDQIWSSLPVSESFCCVCGSSNKDDINNLLECNICLIKVHQACYGVSRVPKGHWYCRPCRTSSRNIVSKRVCVLCGYGGGAMTRALRSRTIVKSLLRVWNVETEWKALSVKDLETLTRLNSSGPEREEGTSFPMCQPENTKPLASVVCKMDMPYNVDVLRNSLCVTKLKVDNSITAGFLDSTTKQWVHMVCGLWTPGTRCPNVDTMSAFDVSGAPHPRADVVCSMCNRPGGSCIKCRVLNCSVRFHPWCAHQKGLLQSEVEGIDNEKVGFYGRCARHATHPMCESDSEPADTDRVAGGSAVEELACARTEGYKGRKRDGVRHNYCQSKGKVGCHVPQEQLNAWIYINGQKSCMQGVHRLPTSDIEHDCRKEYARYKQGKGWKHLVVYKSGIHALGLYTSRFISRGEMVVEYVGEIVGQRVADKRENEYQSGRKLQYKSACYFFRIDKEHIIDATRKGGIARFVNHSCLPNCVAKVISMRNEKKVVFFAERDIFPGEEITYDYHFNHEDEGKKIPCFCNSKNCRRYLN